jgi:hypothetical protein
MHMCIATHTGSSLPDLFTTSWSPSHSGLCQFKIIDLLLYSEHVNHIQVLVSFPFPIPFMHILPLVCDPRPIILLHLF